jgi:hypothetical protein
VQYRGLLCIMSSDLTHPYMGNNVVANPEQCESTISLIKEMFRKNVSLIYSTHCINKAILYLRSDVDHISEEVLMDRLKLT